MWESLRQAGPVFGAEHVALRVASEARRPVFSYEVADGPETWARARYPVGARAALELGWKGRTRPIDRDTETALERLCCELAKALARVDAAPGARARAWRAADAREGRRIALAAQE